MTDAGVERFDAIVIGSGFGGAVSAYHLAEAGKSICLLERGSAYPPGSFARTPNQMSANFWDPSEGQHGLFDLWAFKGIDGVVASGLGGGSLIYANVMLRKDERWFVDERPGQSGYQPWPVTRQDLEPHYDAVERMLLPQSYPYSAQTPKSLAFQEAATKAGLDYSLPPMAITFANPGQRAVTGEPIVGRDGLALPNLHGRTRYTCRLCGECDVGCNYGSKNTLDYNYLSALATNPNASIRTRCEVKAFWPEDGGYGVEYVEHLPEHEGIPTDTDKLPRRRLAASRLVLSAGTFGSTYLILQNRRHFPALSPTVGTHFCGNGDLLGILRGGHRELMGRDEPRIYESSIGSVITSTIRVGDSTDPGGTGPGYYIQDGGYPAFASWLAQAESIGTLRRLARLVVRRLWARVSRSPKSRVGADFAAIFGRGETEASILPLLGMGRDTPDGVLHLDRQGKNLQVDWNSKTSKQYFERVIGTMEDMAGQLGAKFTINPLWHLGQMVITVHALGGCPMGRSANEGVVDSYGRVFNYPGFSIADGSVMPGPVGPNPSLTIAALADRFAEPLIGPVK
jgi:cholesterol oxidase